MRIFNRKKKFGQRTIKQWIIHIVRRSFWGGLWAYLTLIATLEVLLQSLICYIQNDWTLNNLWHVIGWAVWLLICIIVRIVRRENNA